VTPDVNGLRQTSPSPAARTPRQGSRRRHCLCWLESHCSGGAIRFTWSRVVGLYRWRCRFGSGNGYRTRSLGCRRMGKPLVRSTAQQFHPGCRKRLLHPAIKGVPANSRRQCPSSQRIGRYGTDAHPVAHRSKHGD